MKKRRECAWDARSRRWMGVVADIDERLHVFPPAWSKSSKCSITRSAFAMGTECKCCNSTAKVWNDSTALWLGLHRFLPRGMKFEVDCAITGDTVSFFSYSPEYIVAVVESKNISQSLHTLHQLAWKSAVKVLN